MGRVVVEDMDSGVRRELASKKEVTEHDIIRVVELFNVPNVVCERRLAYVTNETDARRHLFDADTHLRAVFVDRYSCLAVTWNRCDGEATTRPEIPPLWLMTVLPAIARRSLSVHKWTRRMSLRTANAIGPDPPFFVVTAAIALHTNFEIYVKGEPSTPRLVWKLCDAFRTMFRDENIQGRMELRFGRRVQFIDLDLLGRGGNAHLAFDVVRRVYAGMRVTVMLHPGKAQVGQGPN